MKLPFKPSCSPVKLVSCITLKEEQEEFDNFIHQTKIFSSRDVLSAPLSITKKSSLMVRFNPSLSHQKDHEESCYLRNNTTGQPPQSSNHYFKSSILKQVPCSFLGHNSQPLAAMSVSQQSIIITCEL